MPDPPQEEDPVYNTCPACGEVMDVSDLEPHSRTSCPYCEEPMRVRSNFDQFSIIEELGQGGMSRVFLAEDSELGRRVALKILNRECSRDANLIAQFEKEALITASISHPNVVKLYTIGQDQGRFYLAMELVSGGSLEANLFDGNTISEEDALRIASQIAQGLREAYGVGLVHRDIKPGNILFSKDGTAKLGDFGLSATIGQRDTGELWGTPYYVPPEKLWGNPEDLRSDIYSLGATLFHALTGRPPHPAETNSVASLKKIKRTPVDLAKVAPHLSPATCALVNRMLAFDHEQRHSSYDELIQEINDARSLLTTAGILPSSRPGTSNRSPALALALGGIALALAATIGFVIYQRNSPEPEPDELDSFAAPTDTSSHLLIGGKTASDIYIAARTALLMGDAALAVEGFTTLANTDELAQPTKNWSRFHLAMAHLLLNQVAPAQVRFSEIAEGANYSTAPEDGRLVEFFHRLARLAADDTLPGQPALSEFIASDELAQALFAIGLFHWHAGDLSQATVFIGAYRDRPHDPNIDWLGRYIELSEPYWLDLKTLDEIRRRADTLTQGSLDALREIREEVVAAISSLRVGGPVEDALRQEIFRIDDGLRDMRLAEQAARRESVLASQFAEASTLSRLLRGLADARKAYDFNYGVRLLDSASYSNPEVEEMRATQHYLYTAAAAFIEEIPATLTTLGYQGTLSLKDGGSIPGQVPRGGTPAAPGRFTIATNVGTTELSIANLTPSCLFEIGGDLADRTSDSTLHYRLQEQRLAFAKLMALDQEMGETYAMMMRESPSFRQRWLRIP